MLKGAFDDVDCVFHLASIASVQRSVEDSIRTDQFGVGGTLDMLTAARDSGARAL